MICTLYNNVHHLNHLEPQGQRWMSSLDGWLLVSVNVFCHVWRHERPLPHYIAQEMGGITSSIPGKKILFCFIFFILFFLSLWNRKCWGQIALLVIHNWNSHETANNNRKIIRIKNSQRSFYVLICVCLESFSLWPWYISMNWTERGLVVTDTHAVTYRIIFWARSYNHGQNSTMRRSRQPSARHHDISIPPEIALLDGGCGFVCAMCVLSQRTVDAIQLFPEISNENQCIDWFGGNAETGDVYNHICVSYYYLSMKYKPFSQPGCARRFRYITQWFPRNAMSFSNISTNHWQISLNNVFLCITFKYEITF
jgi:hypothetical protein